MKTLRTLVIGSVPNGEPDILGTGQPRTVTGHQEGQGQRTHEVMAAKASLAVPPKSATYLVCLGRHADTLHAVVRSTRTSRPAGATHAVHAGQAWPIAHCHLNLVIFYHKVINIVHKYK
jgi:hypothetical protein